MKCKDIHNGLEMAEVRDFLAKSARSGLFGGVEHIKAKISELNKELEMAVNANAAMDLMDANGWREFDVSDEVNDYHRDLYFSFVGTEDEYNSLPIINANE